MLAVVNAFIILKTSEPRKDIAHLSPLPPTAGQMKATRFLTFLARLATLAMTPAADACTAIRLIAKDGAVVYGRTMEWGTFDLNSREVIFPRGQQFTGHTPDDKPGRTWKSQYGFVGLDSPALVVGKGLDGINECVLSRRELTPPTTDEQSIVWFASVPSRLTIEFGKRD